jgi:hypothetical protein
LSCLQGAQDRATVQREALPKKFAVHGQRPTVGRRITDQKDRNGVTAIANLQSDPAFQRLDVAQSCLRFDDEAAIG